MSVIIVRCHAYCFSDFLPLQIVLNLSSDQLLCLHKSLVDGRDQLEDEEEVLRSIHDGVTLLVCWDQEVLLLLVGRFELILQPNRSKLIGLTQVCPARVL